MKSTFFFALVSALVALLLLAAAPASVSADCASTIAAVPTGCGSKRYCEHTSCSDSSTSAYARCCCCGGSG